MNRESSLSYLSVFVLYSVPDLVGKVEMDISREVQAMPTGRIESRKS